MAPKADKAHVTCNWIPSTVTKSKLAEFVKSGHLPKREVMSYRVPNPSEEIPQPKDGEVVVFTDHMNRGFAPPGSKFFRDVLNFFDLRPQDIGPNSVSNLCNFSSLLRGVPGKRAKYAFVQRTFLFQPAK